MSMAAAKSSCIASSIVEAPQKAYANLWSCKHVRLCVLFLRSSSSSSALPCPVLPCPARTRTHGSLPVLPLCVHSVLAYKNVRGVVRMSGCSLCSGNERFMLIPRGTTNHTHHTPPKPNEPSRDRRVQRWSASARSTTHLGIWRATVGSE